MLIDIDCVKTINDLITTNQQLIRIISLVSIKYSRISKLFTYLSNFMLKIFELFQFLLMPLLLSR